LAALLGYSALRAINSSEGRLRGRAFALAGLGSGGLGSLVLAFGVLAMVLTPLWEQSRRAECNNNLRLIGVAVNTYYDVNDHVYPTGTMRAPMVPADKRLSWMASLLPELELKNGAARWKGVFDQLDPTQAYDSGPNRAALDVAIRCFRCPAHPDRGEPSARGWTEYVGITGLGVDSAALPADATDAGFFGYDRVLRIEDITAGTGYTIMALETTVDNGPWVAAGRSTLRGVDPGEEHYIGPGRPFGGCHLGGTPVLYVDGSVHFLGNNIVADVFRSEVRIGHR
jgi:hypothetical protein